MRLAPFILAVAAVGMTGGRSEAAEPPACPEAAALQAVADGRIGDAIRAWKTQPRAEQALRLDILRTWGIEIEGGGTCFRSADCSKEFVSEQADRLRACAASRNVGASILIGTIALNELWSPRDLAAAHRAFSRARIAKSAIPELGLSVVAYLKGSERTSRKLAETAVSLHADVDEYFVGYFFKNAVMFVPDYREAAYWFGLGADRKDWRAQGALAYLYTTGQGVDRDPEKAAMLLREVKNNSASHSSEDKSGIITDVTRTE